MLDLKIEVFSSLEKLIVIKLYIVEGEYIEKIQIMKIVRRGRLLTGRLGTDDLYLWNSGGIIKVLPGLQLNWDRQLKIKMLKESGRSTRLVKVGNRCIEIEKQEYLVCEVPSEKDVILLLYGYLIPFSNFENGKKGYKLLSVKEKNEELFNESVLNTSDLDEKISACSNEILLLGGEEKVYVVFDTEWENMRYEPHVGIGYVPESLRVSGSIVERYFYKKRMSSNYGIGPKNKI